MKKKRHQRGKLTVHFLFSVSPNKGIVLWYVLYKNKCKSNTLGCAGEGPKPLALIPSKAYFGYLLLSLLILLLRLHLLLLRRLLLLQFSMFIFLLILFLLLVVVFIFCWWEFKQSQKIWSLTHIMKRMGSACLRIGTIMRRQEVSLGHTKGMYHIRRSRGSLMKYI